jgi:methylmalonyl-CoA mutase
MTVSSPEDLRLAADFPPATMAQWRRLALGVLRKAGIAGEDTTGADTASNDTASNDTASNDTASDDTAAEAVDELLASTSYDGIRIQPLYTAGVGQPPIGVPGSAPFTRGSAVAATGWDVRQQHADPDPAASNRAVLADLQNGVTSIWLELGADRLAVAALPQVLDGVFLDLAGVVLDAGAETEAAAEAFFDLTAERGARPAGGNLGADPLGWQARTGAPADLRAAVALAARCAAEFPGLRAVTVDATAYHDAGASDAEELAYALATGVAYLRTLTDGGLDLDAALGQLEFRYAATADQFATIAKLRAARRLWARVAEVCGASSALMGAQRQHAVTSSAMITVRDPWVNMLRATLACFAAGVGGAGAVTVRPFDACLGLPDGFARRIARNTQSLLLEEANVARVVDPAGGSWYVERFTEDLATAAWARFTEIERAGGMAAALDSGLVADRLAATWSRREDNLRHRRDPITGVSEFPNLGERLPVRAAGPTPVSGGLPRHRYAEEFEAARCRADAHTAKTGTRPTVFLATLGPVASYTARAAFAANLFAAGGIATVRSGGDSPVDAAEVAAAFAASGATVACICSSDRVYREAAGPVTSALAAAGAARVWLAGPPGEHAEPPGARPNNASAGSGVSAAEPPGARPNNASAGSGVSAAEPPGARPNNASAGSGVSAAEPPGARPNNASAGSGVSAAGVDAYLFAGCDAVDVIETTLRDLGVAQ